MDGAGLAKESKMHGLFPLPLAAFEEFLLADDRPGYRKTFAVELTLDGEIDKQSLEAGLDEAVRRHPLLWALLEQRQGCPHRRHPLLGALLERRRWRRLRRHPLLGALLERRRWRRRRWIDAGNVRPQVIWGAIGDPVEIPDDGAIDLETEVGLRIYLHVGQGRTQAVFLFHHACCDGYGALQFLSDLIVGYVRNLSPDAPDLPAFPGIAPDRLHRRDKLAVSYPPRGKRLWQFLWWSVKYWTRTIFRPAARLAAPRFATINPATTLSFPGTLTRKLEPRVFQDLRRLARRNGVTVNDFLTRELLLTVRDWNRTHEPDVPLKRLSVMVPTNLRNYDHDGMPAANVVSLVFFNRHVDECNDPERLLQSLHSEAEIMKSTRFAAGFLDWVRPLCHIPGLLDYLCRGSSHFATVVLSNVGNQPRAIWSNWPSTPQGDPIFGNLVLRDVNSASPIPTQTRAAFTVWQTNDELRIGLRCDRHVYSRYDAQALLDLFVKRVVLLAQPGDSDSRARLAA
jgi:hypothetical protein